MSSRIHRIPRFGIIIGAMKAGTTAAFQALGQHPEVALAREKELNFFVSDDAFSKGLSDYEAQWNWDDSRHQIAVEASPRLTMVPEYSGAAARIASTDREMRFVYFVRDPISRIQSHYMMYAATELPITPLSQGVDELALACSSYHFQISEYTRLLSRDRILVLTYEQLVERTQWTLEQVCRHFGLGSISFSLPRANWTPDGYLRPLLIRTLSDQGIEVPDSSIDGFNKWFPCLPSIVRKHSLHQIRSQLGLTKKHCLYIRHRLAGEMRALHKDFGVNVGAWGFST
jgi:sulfotransferase family protein